MNQLKLSKALRDGTALRALALLGAGAAGSMLIASPAFAQDYTTGTIIGAVKTEAGETVTGGTATVTSNEQGFSRTTNVGSDGTFRFPQLPTGTYKVVVTPATGTPVSDPNISVTAGSSASYTFTIPSAAASSGGAAGEIVVRGRATRGNDFAATTTGLSLNVQQLVETVPVNRTATSLILLAPGTVHGDNGFGDVASFSGATVAENQYYVNGLNITDFRNFINPSAVPFEFYRTFNVQTGGLTAEYGRALGGVTNAVTKSGSNDWKAGLVVAFSPNSLTSRSPDTYAARNSDDYRQSVDANFYLSGPIIKDHLFFYALYSPQTSDQRDTSITSLARISTNTRTPFLAGKIDANIVDGQRLEFTYFRDRTTADTTYVDFSPTTGQFGRAAGGYREDTGGDNWIATYTGRFTNFFTLSGSYGQNHREDVLNSTPNQPSVSSLLVADPLTGAFTSRRSNGTATSSYNWHDLRKVWRVDADVYAHFLGRHHFRVGYDNEDLRADDETTYNGGYRYIFYSSYIRRYYYHDLNESFKSQQSAYYLEDSWSLFRDRLNFQLGVRNDRFENFTYTGEKYYDQKNQWGPRLGASFDVFGDKRTKISGFWGRYYLPIATNTNIREAGLEYYYQQRFAYPAGVNTKIYNEFGLPSGESYDSTGTPLLGSLISAAACPAGSPDAASKCTSITSDGTIAPIGGLVAAGLKPSYTDEWNVGITQKLGDWTFGLRYINRRLGRANEDIAVDRGVNAYCTSHGISGCADIYTGFNQYVISNPGEDVTFTPKDTLGGKLPNTITLTAAQLGFPKPVRKYDSVEFTFDKPFNGKWSLGGSYTYTKLRGNYEGAVISNINQTDAGITQDYDQQGLLEGAYGDLANGRTHYIKLYGSVKPTNWLLLGLGLQVASPRKFSCLGNYPDSSSYEYVYGAFSYFCQQTQLGSASTTYYDYQTGTTVPIPAGTVLVNRGTAFKSDWYKQLDLGVQIDVPHLPGVKLRADVFNVFNWQDKLDFNEFGDLANAGKNAYYGKVLQYTQPRSVRLTLTVRFGEEGQRDTPSNQSN